MDPQSLEKLEHGKEGNMEPRMSRDIPLSRLIAECSVSGLISTSYVSALEVLDHLLESPLSDTLIAAYATICRMGCSQYVEGKHFCAVTKEVIYKMVYVQVGCDLYVPVEEGKDVKVLTHLAEALALLRQEDEGANIVGNMCDPMPSTGKQSIMLVVRSGNSAGTSALLDDFDTSDKAVSQAVECDYTEPLHNVDPGKYWKKVLTRCKYLSENMNQYWNAVAADKYRALISDKKCQDKATIAQKVALASVLPDVFGSNIRTLTEESVRLLSLPPIARGYVFGYPIHIGLPSESKLIEDALFIQENGVDSYVDKVTKYNKSYSNPIDVCSCFGSVSMVNNETLSASSIFSYNPFDILFYCEDGHIYSFSRESFRHLIEKSTNPYTNKELPKFFLEMVSLRYRHSIVMRVPNCTTLKELLESHMTGNVEQGRDSDNHMRSIESLCTSIGSDFLNGMMSRVSNVLTGMPTGDSATPRRVPLSFSLVPNINAILETS